MEDRLIDGKDYGAVYNVERRLNFFKSLDRYTQLLIIDMEKSEATKKELSKYVKKK